MPQDSQGIHRSWLQDISSSGWFSVMDGEERGMSLQAVELYEREVKLHSRFSDYAFVVFPLAKAYEGFLKKYLLNAGLITEETYASRKFRIGRSMNPDIPSKMRDNEWVYDDVASYCGKDTAKLLWRAWVEGRNLLFHSFPDHRHLLDLVQAKERLLLIISAMNAAMRCLT